MVFLTARRCAADQTPAYAPILIRQSVQCAGSSVAMRRQLSPSTQSHVHDAMERGSTGALNVVSAKGLGASPFTVAQRTTKPPTFQTPCARSHGSEKDSSPLLGAWPIKTRAFSGSSRCSMPRWQQQTARRN